MGTLVRGSLGVEASEDDTPAQGRALRQKGRTSEVARVTVKRARLRVHPTDVMGARRSLDGLIAHVGESCIGFVAVDARRVRWTGLELAELVRCLLLVDR